MRRPKVSLKKYFYFTLFFALLLIFGFNLRERDVWKGKATQLQLSQSQSTWKLHANDIEGADGAEGVDDNDDGSNNEDDVDVDAAKYADTEHNNNVMDLQTITTKPLNSSQQKQQQLQQQRQQQKQRHQNGDTSNIEHESTETLLSYSPASSNINNNNNNNKNNINNNNINNKNSNNNGNPTSRLWFFKYGDYYPKPVPVPASSIQIRKHRRGRKRLQAQSAKLFPYQDPHNDRIINQLMYIPHNYEQIRASGKLKTILLYNGLGPWNVKQGRDVFLRSKCPVDTCEITANRENLNTADMILYKDHFIPTGVRRPTNSRQVTMLYYLECPYHTQNVKIPDAINWTSTYRRDSDIVAPYEKWQYYDSKIRQIEQDRNFALNKTKKVAWFVSNCGARNGRLQFAHDLHKHIDVDIYGACGTFKCSRSTADKCFEILDRDYKFYLAFENSNCKDYITEKFFVNALNRNILPIVMGARPEDYEVSAPHRSYIHVDEFGSPKELAEYLHILDKDEELYNSYFKWKGTGEFINTFFWCRVCASLHNEEALRKPRWYPDVNDWWRGPGVCTNGSWRNFKARKDIIKDDD